MTDVDICLCCARCGMSDIFLLGDNDGWGDESEESEKGDNGA